MRKPKRLQILKKSIRQFFWTSDEEEIEEELSEFIKKFEQESLLLKKSKLKRHGLLEIMKIYHNEYQSQQLAKYTQYLFYATSFLAGATILQTANLLGGWTGIQTLLSFIAIFIFIIAGIKLAINFFGFIYKTIRNK